MTTEVVAFVVMFGVFPFSLRRSDLIGKGRLFSRPLWGLPGFRPLRFGSRVVAGNVRMTQIVALAAMLVPTAAEHVPYVLTVYPLVVGALYLDDLLTGDDDRWNGLRRRIRRTLARRPRLRVRTPVPSPA